MLRLHKKKVNLPSSGQLTGLPDTAMFNQTRRYLLIDLDRTTNMININIREERLKTID